jgi:hypothetical protein
MQLWKVRLGIYGTGIAGVAGLALAAMGHAEFDHATGVIDLAPFNLYTLIGAIPAALSPVVAAVAVVKGWGK